jgi:uncharacterized protein YpmB
MMHMKSKTSIVLSVFLTVLLLVFVVGVSRALANKNNPQTGNMAETVAFYSTREAQYQQLIAQANDTINQANQEILTLQGQDPSQAAPTVSPYPISIEQAIQLANEASGLTTNQAPALVNYSGTAAYEVVYPNGKLYIDANTGSILYNGVMVAKTISAQQAAQIAINYSSNTSQVAGVASGNYSGVPSYRVTFTNGQIVYLNAYGTILAVQAAPAPITQVETGEVDDD